MHNVVAAPTELFELTSVTEVVPPKEYEPSPPLELKVQFEGSKLPVNPLVLVFANDKAIGVQASELPPSISAGTIVT